MGLLVKDGQILSFRVSACTNYTSGGFFTWLRRNGHVADAKPGPILTSYYLILRYRVAATISFPRHSPAIPCASDEICAMANFCTASLRPRNGLF
ncbi:hypothetical protein O988_00502 [Pseudogymnoascus sp. VKM F-3808]|nr:hypothetical protein O988_00502 [Pseudogymnoascus sp. VKM F-3808]